MEKILSTAVKEVFKGFLKQLKSFCILAIFLFTLTMIATITLIVLATQPSSKISGELAGGFGILLFFTGIKMIWILCVYSKAKRSICSEYPDVVIVGIKILATLFLSKRLYNEIFNTSKPKSIVSRIFKLQFYQSFDALDLIVWPVIIFLFWIATLLNVVIIILIRAICFNTIKENDAIINKCLKEWEI
ncbi:hypothetical protein [[Acholeplasma] multilocale]|uniref:hypothetical protein n=1 Tax=[Acholeplasma] multilocale TaxID=264638 RepID=UPI00047DC874|nr:hypothetical protein [[Acholeplasma] multilocale]